MQATILVVDDTPSNISILMEILRGDYRVLAATSGANALKIARGDPPPDLILPNQPPAGPAPIADQIRKDYQNQMQQQLAGAKPPGDPKGALVGGLAGFGLGAGTGNPVAAGVGAGMGLLGQQLKNRRSRINTAGMFAKGGLVDVQRMAQGGAAKERRDFPKTIPPKKGRRGMGAATRGAGKAQG